MLKKMLILALLIPGLGGCVLREARGPHEHRDVHEGRRHRHETTSHSHGDGCGHVFRGGVWIVVR